MRFINDGVEPLLDETVTLLNGTGRWTTYGMTGSTDHDRERVQVLLSFRAPIAGCPFECEWIVAD
jgi:hypothetical protein